MLNNMILVLLTFFLFVGVVTPEDKTSMYVGFFPPFFGVEAITIVSSFNIYEYWRKIKEYENEMITK